jgi:heme exporter protein B
VLHDALLIAGKDLRIELRSKVALNQVLPFALVVLILFGLALDPTKVPLASAAAGLFWVAALLSTVLAVQRCFAIETVDRAGDGLRLLGIDPAGIFIGKACAIFVELILLEGALAIGAALLYQIRLSGAALLIGTCLVATIGLVAIGTIYGAITVGTKGGETLLPLVFFPVVAPVLLCATKAWNNGLAGTSASGWIWLDVLAAFAVIYTAIGVIAFGPLLEDQ